MRERLFDEANTRSAHANVWVAAVGGIIIARIRGAPTADLLQDCQARVIALQHETGCDRVMYDALELQRPSIDVVLAQQKLTSDLKREHAKIAIVVPNTGIAYLARLAFGDANHRVFYNDMAAAVLWLTEGAVRGWETVSR